MGAVQAGLPVQAAELILTSYDLFPAGQGLAGPDLAEWGLAQVGRATGLAFSLSAPFALAGLVWNLALGLVNRAMPHLPVSFIGAPALSFGGLALLLAASPLLLQQWQAAFVALLQAPGALP